MNFLTEDFLLQNQPAKRLYHEFAKNQPIIDYHCHLNPVDIKNNKKFTNLTEIWLKGDHYKWRAMRTLGVDEKYITGDADDYDKFLAWAKCVPQTIGNPLYHWTHLELRRPFGITDRVLNPKTAPSIWNDVNNLLLNDEFTTRGIIKQMNVEVICTTDDPIDSLEDHISLKNEGNSSFKMLPTFRPDRAVAVENPREYLLYIKKLEEVTGITISTYNNLLQALEKRHSYFHEAGCRLSDHALTKPEFENYTEADLNDIFHVLLKEESINSKQVAQFKTALFQFFGRLNSKRSWTMQLHIGALRNNNSRMFSTLGADIGFDSIADGAIAYPLSRLLDSLDKNGELPKTILYVLNPADNDTIATMIGNFQDGKTPGKIQFGSGWWFNDQKTGMENQLISLGNMGILSKFVGMLTDSRSFLSYTRHEYFRRILCNLIGTWVTNGEAPEDYELLGSMVSNICYNNSKEYFNFI